MWSCSTRTSRPPLLSQFYEPNEDIVEARLEEREERRLKFESVAAGTYTVKVRASYNSVVQQRRTTASYNSERRNNSTLKPNKPKSAATLNPRSRMMSSDIERRTVSIATRAVARSRAPTRALSPPWF